MKYEVNTVCNNRRNKRKKMKKKLLYMIQKLKKLNGEVGVPGDKEKCEALRLKEFSTLGEKPKY